MVLRVQPRPDEICFILSAARPTIRLRSRLHFRACLYVNADGSLQYHARRRSGGQALQTYLSALERPLSVYSAQKPARTILAFPRDRRALTDALELFDIDARRQMPITNRPPCYGITWPGEPVAARRFARGGVSSMETRHVLP